MTIDNNALKQQIGKWLEQNGILCVKCKHYKRSEFEEPCKFCIHAVDININFEPI